MRIPEKIYLFCAAGASALLLLTMFLFLCQNFTGLPQLKQDLADNYGDLEQQINAINQEITNTDYGHDNTEYR